jgi:hypothetical protein
VILGLVINENAVSRSLDHGLALPLTIAMIGHLERGSTRRDPLARHGAGRRLGHLVRIHDLRQGTIGKLKILPPAHGESRAATGVHLETGGDHLARLILEAADQSRALHNLKLSVFRAQNTILPVKNKNIRSNLNI